MNETGGSRPDIDALEWARGPGAFPITEPGSGQKDAGYDPGPPGEIPTAENWNWFLNQMMNSLRWLDASHEREFSDLGIACGDTSPADVFRVGQPSAGNRALGLLVYTYTPTGFTLITDAASDGENVYYLNTAGRVAAVNPDDGTELWNPGVTSPTGGAIAADGRDVYICGDAVLPGLLRLNRDTGAIVDRTGTPQAASAIAANGQFVVMADGALLPNNLYYYTVATVPSVETGFTSHGNPVSSCAVDEASVYWGGIQGGGIDVRCNDLATRSAVWTSVLDPGGLAPIIQAIETDGSYVYVGTQRKALLAGGFANLFVLDAAAGQLIGADDIQVGGGTDNITNIALDGKYVHCTLDGATGGVLTIGGNPGSFYLERDLSSLVAIAFDADGIGLIASDGTAAAERYYYQEHPVRFQRAGFGDVNRRPFHKLAIPIR